MPTGHGGCDSRSICRGPKFPCGIGATGGWGLGTTLGTDELPVEGSVGLCDGS